MLAAAAPLAGAAGGGSAFSMLATPFAGALGDSLGSALGGESGPTVSGADGNRVEAVFDNSGWNVNFGEGDITSDRQQLPALGGFDTTTLIIIAVVGLVALKIMNKGKK